MSRAPGVRLLFPPQVVVQVKALACELPATSGVPLSRYTRSELVTEVVRRGIAAQISGATIWRWLSEDAIRPWQYRSWLFPRHPHFAESAGPVLDLYQRRWENQPLSAKDFVLSTDEQTGIRARIRLHETQPTAARQAMRVEAEYERGGARVYLAAWDVHRARIFGRCEVTTGIAPFSRRVAQVMAQEPYRSAERVFWIMDNGDSHRGQAGVNRLRAAHPNIVPVHLPVHASWLNQIEIYFSLVQRKVLTPNDFSSLTAVAERLPRFEHRYEQVARSFDWTFTREDLANLPKRLPREAPSMAVAA